MSNKLDNNLNVKQITKDNDLFKKNNVPVSGISYNSMMLIETKFMISG